MPDLSGPPPPGPLSARVALQLANDLAPAGLKEAVERVDLILHADRREDPVVRWAVGQGPLDAWERFCLVGSGPDGVGSVALLVDRYAEDAARPALTIEAVFYPSHVRPDARTAGALAHVVATMMACDAEKVRFRTGAVGDVTVDLSSATDDEDPWVDRLRDLALESLGARCAVAAGPAYPGP